MSVIYSVSIILLVLACIVLLCLVAVWLEKRYPVEDFDERQKVVRGRAYRLSYWAGVVYYVCLSLLLIQQVDGKKSVEPWFLVAIGFLLQAEVFHTYCLLNHAALPLSAKPFTTILGSFFCGVLQLVAFYDHYKQYSMSFVGHGTSAWMFLIAGICFFYLGILHIIQLIRDCKG